MEMHFYGKLTIGLDIRNLRLGFIWALNDNHKSNISLISETGILRNGKNIQFCILFGYNRIISSFI